MALDELQREHIEQILLEAGGEQRTSTLFAVAFNTSGSFVPACGTLSQHFSGPVPDLWYDHADLLTCAQSR